MVNDFSTVGAVLADAVVWTTWSIAIGLVGSRWTDRSLSADGPLTRLRPFERQGQLYVAWGIRAWKRWLPDAGRFGGGRRKTLGRSRDRADWRALERETRRAERVHWLTVLALPVTLLWSGGVLFFAMIAYAMVANLPCIAAQRYNRARLLRLSVRADRAGDRGSLG